MDVERIQLVYEPGLIGATEVRFVDRKRKINEQLEKVLLLSPPIDVQRSDWGDAVALPIGYGDLLDDRQLAMVVAGTCGIEFVNLAPEMVDSMVAHLVPYKMASQHNLIPMRRQDNLLYVAMSSPLNLSVRNQIEKHSIIPLGMPI